MWKIIFVECRPVGGQRGPTGTVTQLPRNAPRYFFKHMPEVTLSLRGKGTQMGRIEVIQLYITLILQIGNMPTKHTLKHTLQN